MSGCHTHSGTWYGGQASGADDQNVGCPPGGSSPLMTREVTVYVGRSNAIGVVLLTLSDDTPLDGQTLPEDWKAVNLGFVTRVVFTLGSVVIDSDINPEAFDWSTQDAAGNDLLVIKPGPFFTEPTTGYATIATYDASNPAGVIWINSNPEQPPTLVVKVINE